MSNSVLRVLLLVWVLGYLLISCGALISGDLGGGVVGLVAGAVLFVPWLVGVVVLGALVWITNPRRG
jgi:hypothetical protein